MALSRRGWLHVLLFSLTVASTWLTGGLAYSFSVMAILLGHEMGHYFVSRSYGGKASLPYFLPFPFSPFGTLGAVIRMEGAIVSRKALFDIGAAGPLVSFFLSVPAIAFGLEWSEVVHGSELKEGMIRLSDPFLFSLVQKLVIGEVKEGYEVLLHPVGYAGWVGLFVTSLNLLPVGQLDGGHVAYALFGRKSRLIFLVTVSVMAFITFFYNPGWFIFLALLVLFGFRHPSPLDDQTPIDGKRKLIGVLIFLAFILSFTPAPFPEFAEEFRKMLSW